MRSLVVPLCQLLLLQLARCQNTHTTHLRSTHTTHAHGHVTDPTDTTDSVGGAGPNGAAVDVSVPEMVSTTAVPANCGAAFLADIVFVLDASESVGAASFEELKTFVQGVVSDFGVGENAVRIGVVKYSDMPMREFYLNSFFTESEVNTSIANIVYTMGQTNTGSALDFVRTEMFNVTNGDRPGVPNVAIVITDGQSTNPNDTVRAAQEARDAGIIVYSVGVGSEVDMHELETITTNPDKNVFTVGNYSSLESIADNFRLSVCPVNTATTEEPTPPTTEEIIIESTRCPQYRQADIVFVLDSSVSVGSASFEELKEFIAGLVNNFDIGEDKVRVGAMKFSDNARSEFTLNSHYNKTELNASIANIVYVMGVTNTGSALDFLRTTMFTPVNGDRPKVPNVAVVITDGKSSEPNDTVRAAAEARDAGIIIFAIGVGSGAELSELEEIASGPSDTHVFTAINYTALSSITSTFQEAVCIEPATEEPTTPAPTTTEEPSTTTKEPCFDVFPAGCRESGVGICIAYEAWARLNCAYYCRFCESETYKPIYTTQEVMTTQIPQICEQADIVFVLDSSVSVSAAGFTQLKDFVITLVAGFEIGDDEVRVGIIKYSDNVTTEFTLKDSFNDKDLNGTIANIVYKMGVTNTGKALDFLLTDMFTEENGDRPGVPNVAVVITDGESTDSTDTTRAAQEVKAANITVFAIGVGEADRAELKVIATDPETNHVFTVTDYSALPSIKASFEDRVCPSFQVPVTTGEPTEAIHTTWAPSTEYTGVGGGVGIEITTVTPAVTTQAIVITTKRPEAPLTTTMVFDPNCTDVSPDCGALGQPVCTDYRSWSLFYCRRSCNLCHVPVVREPECCNDQDGWDRCIDKHLDGCTGIYAAWARAHCQGFCGYCKPCPITPCVNKINNCAEFGEYSCTDPNMRLWAYQNCMEHCGLCYNYGYYWELNPNVTKPTAPTPPAVTVAPSECKDLVNDCEVYGKADCTEYDSFMTSYCPLYCGFCSNATQAPGVTSTGPVIPANCSDTFENCTSYALQHCCGIYEPWARAHCAKYCGFCGVVPDRLCTDQIDYCDREPSDLCTNDRYLLFRQANCAGFCKLCDAPWEPPPCTASLFPGLVTGGKLTTPAVVLLG